MTEMENNNDAKSVTSDDEWEECYFQTNCASKSWNSMFGDYSHLQFFKKQRKTKKGKWHMTYWQTFGGGPEGGYIQRSFRNAEGKTEKEELYAVERTWGVPFSVKLISGKIKYRFNEDGAWINKEIKVEKHGW